MSGRVWGDGVAEGVRQRAAEELKTTARAAARLGAGTVTGFTGSSIWKCVAMFPPVPDAMIERGYEDFANRWNPIIDVFDEVGCASRWKYTLPRSPTTTGRQNAPSKRSATARGSG